MGIVFGLLSALGWGLGDFVSRFASRQLGAYRTVFYFNLIGLAGVGLYVLLSGELVRRLEGGTPSAWLWLLAASVTGNIASLALFKAFEHGVLALVSPISSSYSALTTALAVLSGERLGTVQWIGLGVVLLAIVLASVHLDEHPHPVRKHRGLPPGVGWALLASLCFGLTYWMLGFYVVPALGSFVPNVVSTLVGLGLLWAASGPMKERLTLPPRGSWGLLALIAFLLNFGAIVNNLGLEVAEVSVVTVVSSLYTALTVLLASVFLRERLAKHQWAGVGLALVGIGLVNLK
ncbi:MAG: EamA family transporter [Meiothermus sp.]|nr:EamA family transporter [Meiothermus sp.]